MSLKTWIQEYYLPRPDDALKASILQWEGLQHENLRRHNCYVVKGWVTDNTTQDRLLDGSVCLLCNHFSNDGCHDCPICLARNGVNCCFEMSGELVSPWRDFVVNNDPVPMLYWLKQWKDIEDEAAE